MSVRVRFAPSPTGYLHVGGLRTALYNYIFAKQNKGKLVLRIEDTDRKRFVDDAQENLISSLSSLGIEFDEGPGIGGDCGPYIQSERLDIYQDSIISLIESGHAYACKANNENNSDDIFREQSIESSFAIIEHEKYYVRLKMPDKGIVKFTDLVRGSINFNFELIEDPIILKSDGYPTYHLANVVDDHMMGITHVMRGEEWLSSMPKHLYIYKSLGWEYPSFIHLPLLLNSDKSKLSKRQGDVHVQSYIEKGFLEDALINFVALLGWHPSSDRELFDINRLIDEFSIDRIQKAGAIFDIEKLNWMNKTYIKSNTPESLVHSINGLLSETDIDISDREKLHMAIGFAIDRVTTINEIIDEIKPFYGQLLINNDFMKYIELGQANNLFSFWVNKCIKLDSWNTESIKDIIDQSQIRLGIKGKDLYFPLRTVLYGNPKGPDIPLISLILGKDLTIKRIKEYIK
mgnify:CR=1 FL=1